MQIHQWLLTKSLTKNDLAVKTVFTDVLLKKTIVSSTVDYPNVSKRTLRNLNQCLTNALGVACNTSNEWCKILIEGPMERFPVST